MCIGSCQNLGSVDGKPEDRQAICPVCLQAVAESEFSEGHIFPQSLGLPTDYVVECKRCNSELGSKCDVVLVALGTLVQSVRGQASPKAVLKLMKNQSQNVTFCGERIRPVTRITGSGIDYSFCADMWSPQIICDGGWTAELSFAIGRAESLRGAILHSGLLWMYKRFGHLVRDVPSWGLVRRCLYEVVELPRDELVSALSPVIKYTSMSIREPNCKPGIYVACDESHRKFALAFLVPYSDNDCCMAVFPLCQQEADIEHYCLQDSQLIAPLIDCQLDIQAGIYEAVRRYTDDLGDERFVGLKIDPDAHSLVINAINHEHQVPFRINATISHSPIYWA